MRVRSVELIALLGCLVLKASGNIENVPYCGLVGSPDKYVGKEIRVRAIYNYFFEVQRLDPPDCCAGKPLKIWVELGDLSGRSEKLFHRLPKGMGLGLVVFTGVLESGGPFGDGGYRLRFDVDQIETVEAVAATGHMPAASEPRWVPRNCGNPGQ